MNLPRARWKMLGLLALIAAILIGAIILVASLMHPGAARTEGASTTVTNGAPGGSGSSTASPAPAPPEANGQNIPPLPGAAITIHLLTPISGNVWTMGQANPIAWDNPADITGEIDLVNANTKAFIGVILAETGPKQTSYTWNAQEVYLGRYSADEVAVVPGTYSIRIHFDGNGLGDLVSGPITITN